jgi:glutamate decarboxylase
MSRLSELLRNTFLHRLAYAGVGWALWRSKEFLPEEILFTVNYLGSPQVSFTLNFSKSSVQVIGQCKRNNKARKETLIKFRSNTDYQLIRLGKSGYRAIMSNLTQTADYLADAVVKFGDGNKFVLMSKTGEVIMFIPMLTLLVDDETFLVTL